MKALLLVLLLLIPLVAGIPSFTAGHGTFTSYVATDNLTLNDTPIRGFASGSVTGTGITQYVMHGLGVAPSINKVSLTPREPTAWAYVVSVNVTHIGLNITSGVDASWQAWL